MLSDGTTEPGFSGLRVVRPIRNASTTPWLISNGLNISAPLWMSIKIVTHSLVLEEKTVISESARHETLLRGQANVCDVLVDAVGETNGIVGVVACPDLKHNSACFDILNLLPPRTISFLIRVAACHGLSGNETHVEWELKVVDIVTILVHATGIRKAKGVNDAAIGFDELALDSVLLALVVEGINSGSEVICEEIPAI